MSLLPTDPKHPFWFATTGSQIELRLIKPPASEINSLIVSVYSISEPFTYKLDRQSSPGRSSGTTYKLIISQNDSPRPRYCNKKEAIRIIKNDWWQYYGDRTSVNFIEHKNVEFNSCPNTPSPRSVRKNSFKSSLLELKPSPTNSPVNSESEDEKSPRWFQIRISNSPRNSSPRSSPRTPNSSRRHSSSSSPRTPKTPRSRRFSSKNNTPRSDCETP